jgi:hypothetical protein
MRRAGCHERGLQKPRYGRDPSSRDVRGLERQALLANVATYAPTLGRELCALGRFDEAEPLAQRGRELGARQLGYLGLYQAPIPEDERTTSAWQCESVALPFLCSAIGLRS